MSSLIDESNCELSLQDEFVWEFQTNVDQWCTTQTTDWIPYSKVISSAIEEAYKREFREIVIDGNHRIDLKYYTQQQINKPHGQLPIRRRRCCPPSTVRTDEETEDESSCRERLSLPLRSVLSCSATGDTNYYGSSFVHTWLLMFTKGRMKVTFNAIFPVLVKGLMKEGRADTKNKVLEISVALTKVEKETHGKTSKNRIKELQECCVKLYTKACYIYRVVNAALRNNDQTKLYTLGPFCYLLFNYIGQHSKSDSSIGDRLRRVLRPNKIQSFTLYRGDHNSGNTVEEYRRAAGDNSKRFKWLPFVSTSSDKAVAERFAGDTLYIIEIPSYSSNEDQFTNLTTASYYTDEKEILLLPGVQFQVEELEYDNEKGQHLVYIKINSSYISKLK